MTPPISPFHRWFSLGSAPAETGESELTRLWSQAQDQTQGLERGEPAEDRLRQGLDRFLTQYQSRNLDLQGRYRPMAVLAWAQRRLIDGDPDGVLSYLRLQSSQYPELGQVEALAALTQRLEERHRLSAGQFISQIAHAAVQIDLDDRLPHTRWWNRSEIEGRLERWARSYQTSVQGGEDPLAAFERLQPEFLRISPSLGQVMNEEGLWNRIGLIGTRDSVSGMEMQLMDLAGRWSRTRPELASILYQSLRDSTFAREAQEAQARLGGQASRFLRNLTPWTAESNRAFAMNLLTVGAFVGTSWVGAGIRGVVGRSLSGLLGAEMAANLGGRFLIGSGQWLAGTVSSAALLPVLTHGGDPFVQGTYLREFGHNFVFSGFLGLSGAWTALVQNAMARGLASYVSAVGGMAAFDLSTQPALRQESPLELSAYFLAQDALGRVGHHLGEQSRQLAQRTILDETWQNQTQARLASWWNGFNLESSPRLQRLAPAALMGLGYFIGREMGWEAFERAGDLLGFLGLAMGGTRPSIEIRADHGRVLEEMLRSEEFRQRMGQHPSLRLQGIDREGFLSVLDVLATQKIALGELDLSGNPNGPALLEALGEYSNYASSIRRLNLSYTRLWDRGLETLLNMGLRTLELDLGRNYITKWGMLRLAADSNLIRVTHLNLNYNAIGREGVEALTSSEYSSSLLVLNLGNTGIGEAGALVIAAERRLAGLTSLNLEDNQIGSEGIRALASATHLSGLTHLDLNRNQVGIEGVRALAGATHLSELTFLDLEDAQIGAEGVQALAGATHLSRLTSLNLANNQIGDEGIRALASATHLSGLTHLNLNRNQVGNENVRALVGATHLSGLTHLDLGFNEIGAEGIRALAGATHLSRLTSLNLAINRVGAEGVRALAGAIHLSRLTYLNLGWNEVGAAGVRELAGAAHLSGLTHLDLMSNQIGDEGAREFATASHLSGLTALSLARNQIGNEGVRALASATHLSGLTHLDLGFNQIGAAGVRALAGATHLARLTYLGLIDSIRGKGATVLRKVPHLRGTNIRFRI